MSRRARTSVDPPELKVASTLSCPELKPIPAIMERLGKLLGMIVGRDVADEAFEWAAGAMIGHDELNRYSSWAYAVSRRNEQSLAKWPLGRKFYELREFAYRGLVVIDCKPYRRGQAVAGLIRDIDNFLREAPASWGLNEAATTLAMAKGRVTLNKGQPIDVDTLALLGGVKPSHIRNMMVKRKAKLQRCRTDREKVEAKSALGWLSRRSCFHPTNY
jgi:hypothetical protein